MLALLPVLVLCAAAGEQDQEFAKAQAIIGVKEKIRVLRTLAAKAEPGGNLHSRIRLELSNSLLIAGNYEEAESESRAAAAALTGNREKSRALNVQGTSWLYRAEYAKALSYYNVALPLADIGARITILNNAGNAHYYLGEYGEAWKRYAEAKFLLEGFQGKSKQEDEFTTAVNQATILQRLGKDREAMKTYRELESLAAKDDDIGRGQLLANLGAVYRRLGDPYKALSTYQRALANFEKGQYPDGTSGAWINIGIAHLVDMRDYAAARLAFGQAIRTVNGREKLQARLYLAETDRRDGKLPDARAGFAKALEDARAMKAGEEIWKSEFGLGRSTESPAEAKAHIRAALDQIESIRANVRKGSQRRDFLSDKRDVYDAYLDLLTEPAELFEWMEKSRARMLQDEIPLQSLAAIQARLRPDEVLLETSSLPRGFLLLFIGRDSARAARIADLGQLPGALEPILKARLIVVPDRKFSSLSFDALQLPRKGQFLVEQTEVSYMPAANLLRNRPPTTPLRFPWQKSVLAVAVPKVSQGIDRDLPPLQQVGAETRIVAASLTGRSSLVTDPSKQALLGELGRYPVLHFASHAVIDPQDSSRSRLVLESDSLFLRDLEQVNLSGLQLVTLSACQTASGEEIAGEGVESLANGFLRAGAKSVIAALTPVNDQASVEFIRGLYFGLGKGLSPAAALRDSKLRFLRSSGTLADPKHWAPYVVYGNSGDPVSKPPAWLWWAVGISMAALILLLSAAMKFRKRPTIATEQQP